MLRKGEPTARTGRPARPSWPWSVLASCGFALAGVVAPANAQTLGEGDLDVARAEDGAIMAEGPGWALATRASTQWSRSEGRAGFGPSTLRYTEGSIGLAYRVSPDFRISLEPTFRETVTEDVDALPGLQSGRLENDSYRLRSRLEFGGEPFGLRADLTLGYETYEQRRPSPESGTMALAESSGPFLEAEVAAHYSAVLTEGFLLRPIAILRASRREIDGYEESGAGGFDLIVDDIVQHEVEVKLGGVAAAYDVYAPDSFAAVFAGGFWRRALVSEDFEADASIRSGLPLGRVTFALGPEDSAATAVAGFSIRHGGLLEGLFLFEHTRTGAGWASTLSGDLIIKF